MDRHRKTYYMGYGAILTALAMIFSYVEAILPFTIGIPGVKLGIANIVIVIALYKFGVKMALSINVIRIIVSGLLFSGAFGIFYSLAGGILSFIAMLIIKSFKCFSIVGVSMTGGVFHNLGQLLTAAFLVSNLKMFVYFPVLLFSGLATGIINGIVAGLVLEKLDKANI